MRMNKDDMEIFFEALDGMPCAKENKCAEKYRELYKLVEDLVCVINLGSSLFSSLYKT